MIGAIDKNFSFMENALNLRAYRQQVLASNIANADTPNYKARDIDFAAELRRAQGAKIGKLGLDVTAPGHRRSSPGNPLGTQLLYRSGIQPSIDGNTVDMDVERSEFTGNAIHYQAVLTFLGGQFKTMLSAIKGE
jgi:flagellar basal-body rod protein FlgB